MTIIFSAMCIADCLFLSPTAFAENIASGTCGDNLTWTLDTDGLLTINGSGETDNFATYSADCWLRYKGSVYSVADCPNLKYITFRNQQL